MDPETSTITETSSESGEDQLSALLSSDLTGGGAGTAEHVAEDPSVADVDIATQETEGTQPEGATEDTGTVSDEDNGEASPEEVEAGLEGLDSEEFETDYAESAYQKAAAHWEKQYGVHLDPNDKGQRALLKEMMDRGQKIRELSSQAPRAEGTEAEEKPAVAAAPVKTPQELFQDRWKQAKEYAKVAVVPEVAQAFAENFVNAIWPGKNVKVSAEQARGLAEAFTEFGSMLIADAIPAILGATPQAVERAYPMLGRVHSMAEREAVVDDLLSAADQAGNAMYPGIDKLLESGAIKKLLDGPDLKNAVFDKDPYKNLLAKTKAAYKMARGIRTDPKTLERAVARGKAVANERSRSVAAGRLSPGSPSGRSPSADNRASNFMQSLVNSGGGKFSRMLKEHGK